MRRRHLELDELFRDQRFCLKTPASNGRESLQHTIGTVSSFCRLAGS